MLLAFFYFQWKVEKKTKKYMFELYEKWNMGGFCFSWQSMDLADLQSKEVKHLI